MGDLVLPCVASLCMADESAPSADARVLSTSLGASRYITCCCMQQLLHEGRQPYLQPFACVILDPIAYAKPAGGPWVAWKCCAIRVGDDVALVFLCSLYDCIAALQPDGCERCAAGC